MTNSEQREPSPIDTVREALERVKGPILEDGPYAVPFDSSVMGRLYELERRGRDLLEAIKKYGGELGYYPDMHWQDWAHHQAAAYARRVKEVVG